MNQGKYNAAAGCLLGALIGDAADTDTNSCIVGGLIGAAVGVDNIPNAMKESVLNCDTTKGKHPRPDFLHPRQINKLIPKLLKL